MNWRIFAAGKPALAYAKSGIEEYLKRLKRGSKIELLYLKAGDSESVSAHLLERSKGTFRIVLDERGQAWGTEELVWERSTLGKWIQASKLSHSLSELPTATPKTSGAKLMRSGPSPH